MFQGAGAKFMMANCYGWASSWSGAQSVRRPCDERLNLGLRRPRPQPEDGPVHAGPLAREHDLSRGVREDGHGQPSSGCLAEIAQSGHPVEDLVAVV